MSERSSNTNRSLDDYLDDERGQQDYKPRSNGGYNKQAPANQRHHPTKKKNPIVAVLLSAVLVVGISVLMIQIFRPFDGGNNQNTPGGNNQGVLGDSKNKDDFVTKGNPPNGNDGVLYGPGPDGGNGNDEPVKVGPGFDSDDESDYIWSDNSETSDPDEYEYVPDDVFSNGPFKGNEGDGPVLIGPGPGGNGAGQGIISKRDENGNKMYSDDGGTTWSYTPPSGVQIPGQ